MNFYNNAHPYYCDIDLHARLLYVCLSAKMAIPVSIKKSLGGPDQLKKLLKPCLGNIVVVVECMHCWYCVSDFCEELGVDFILGHALYMKAIHGGKAKNGRIDS